MSECPRLFIATPTAGGIMLAPYVTSLVAMLLRLQTAGIATEYRTLDGSDLIGQRNLLAAEFLASDCTHLLFIDSDMAFEPGLVERLLGLDKALVGAVYPKRRIDLAQFAELATARSFDDALALSHDWNVQPLGAGITLTKGVGRVLGLPGGFLLITRHVFERMRRNGDVPVIEDGAGRATAICGFFREMAEGSIVHDLDYAFCRRWAALGGEVWAYAAAEVRHVGDFRDGASFAAALRPIPTDALAGSRPRHGAQP